MVRLRSIWVGAGICLAATLLPWVGYGAYVYAAAPDALRNPSIQSKRAATRTLLAVTRVEKRLIAVGERGIVLLSDDNGNTWRQAKVPVSVTLTGVHFPTPTKGWAVGHSGAILHSEDAGETWTKQLDGIQAAKLVAEFAKERAEVVGKVTAQAIIADAERFVADGPDKPFLDVHFSDESHGLVVGAYGLAFATNDGGRHWLPWITNIPNPNGKHLYRIHSRETELWIVGEQGALFRSKDRGANFVEETFPYVGSLFGMISSTECNLVAFGLRGNAFHSGDCGRKWRKIGNATEATLTAGALLDDGSMVLVDQAGRIIRSTDQGRSFIPLPINQQFPVTGISQGADGSLVLTSLRGVIRIPAIKPKDSQQ